MECLLCGSTEAAMTCPGCGGTLVDVGIAARWYRALASRFDPGDEPLYCPECGTTAVAETCIDCYAATSHLGHADPSLRPVTAVS